VDAEGAFAEWVAAHAKPYLDDAAEYAQRLSVWRANVAAILAHNARLRGGAAAGPRLDVNEYADLTWEEFSATRLGLRPREEGGGRLKAAAQPFRYADTSPPDRIDWRERNAVTPVKNQARARACSGGHRRD